MADEPFKASDEDWQRIEEAALTRCTALWDRVLCELRDRVAALEAERVAPEASTVPTPPAAVPSDEELWGLRFNALLNADPELVATTWDAARSLVFGHAHIKANRALYNHGFQRGLAAGRAEQGTTPEPTHPQYFSSNHAIAGEIWGMLPDAPEPNQAPAGDGGLVDTISDIIENEPIIGRPPEEEWKPEARAVILAVAKWLEKYKPSGHETEPTSADFFAYVLRQEAQR